MGNPLDILSGILGYTIIFSAFISLFFTLKGTVYKKNKEKYINNVSIVFLVVPYSIFFLFGLEMLKDPGTTWGDGSLPFGGIIIIPMIYIFHFFKKNKIHGFSKLIIGIVTIFLIGKYGFPEGISIGVYRDQIIARWGVIFVGMIYIIEGVLLSVNHLLKIKK